MSGGDEQPAAREAPLAEWVVAVASLLLVLTVIAYLVYDAVTSPSLPPDIRVSVDTIVSGRANHIVGFTAQNLGGSTGASVQISGELYPSTPVNGDPDELIERSIATIRFVPARSTRHGGLFFTQDPRRYRLVLRAEGFSSP